MRIAIVVVGIVLAIVGAVLLFVPVVPQASESTTSSAPFALFSVSGFSITGSIPVSVSWSTSATVEIVAITCSANCNSSGLPSLASATIQSGTSGSFTLSQPNGGEVGIAVLNSSSPGTAPPPVTFKVTTALSTVGSVLLIVGIVVLILGAVIKSKKAKMAAAAPMSSMPMSPSTTGPTQDAYGYPPAGPGPSNPPGSPPMGPS